MADRFPLILNTSANQIQEIGSGDQLDLSGNNIANAGIITAGNVTIGAATTDLVVTGDARITGILTIGTSSLKLDGPNNLVNVGTALTLGHSQGLQFHTQNLHSAGFEVNQINSSGIITATGAVVNGDIDLNGDIDVDGHTNLDNVSIAGVTTTSGLLDINAGGQANTFKVEDLTDNRIVIAGTGGELEDSANLTFDGSTLTLTGSQTISGDVDVDGHTNLDNVSVAGVTTFAGAIDLNADLDVDGHTNLDNVNIAGVTTFIEDITLNGANFDITYDRSQNTVNFDQSFLKFGTSGNMSIRNTNIEGLTTIKAPGLYIRNTSNAQMITCYTGGQIELYHNNSKKLNTTNTGAEITGNLVASGNVSGVDGTFTGNVSIGGTLTYEDVSNIDSVGIVTARSGLVSPNADIDDFISVGSNIHLGNAGVVTATSFVGSGAALTGIDATSIKDSGGNVKIQAQASGAVHSGISTFNEINLGDSTGSGNNRLKFGVGKEFQIYHNSVHTMIENSTGALWIKSTHAGHIYLYTGGSHGIYLDGGDGHVYPSSDSAIDIGSNAVRFRNVYADTLYGDGSNLTGIDATQIVTGNTSVQTVDTGSDGHVKVNTEGSERLRIDSSGRVLIGTTTEGHPNANNLTIAGSTNSGITLRSANDSFSAIYFSDATSGTAEYEGAIVYGHSGNTLRFGTNHDTWLEINSSGNVTPYQDSTNDLGENAKRWRNLYADTLYGNGSNLTNVTAAAIQAYQSYALWGDRSFSIGQFHNTGIRMKHENFDHSLLQNEDDDNSAYFEISTKNINPIRFRIDANDTSNGDFGWDINTSGHFVPSTDSARDIGTNTVRVRNLYADTLYGSGANLTNISSDLVNDTSPQLGGNLDSNGKNIKLGDSSSSNDDRLQIGAATYGDLELFHDGTNSYITNITNDLLIQNSGDDIYIDAADDIFIRTSTNEDAIKCLGDGAVELYHNNVKKLNTFDSGVVVSGDIQFYDGNELQMGSSSDFHIGHDGTNNIIDAVNSHSIRIQAGGSNVWEFGSAGIFKGNDGKKIILGDSSDFQFFHDGTYNYIDCTNGKQLRIVNDTQGGNELMIKATPNDRVELYYNGSMKLWTQSWGAQCGGDFVPNGNNAYDLGASNERWRNLYTNDLNLSNEGGKNDVDGTWGNYTIQEGESELFLINNRNGKKYKFNLTEVS